MDPHVDGLEAYLIFDESARIWPLDSVHVAEFEIMGKPVYMHLIEALNSFARIKKIVVLNVGKSGDIHIDNMNQLSIEIVKERIDRISMSVLKEITNSLRDPKNDAIITHAFDPAVIFGSFPIHNKNMVIYEQKGKIVRPLVYIRSGSEWPEEGHRVDWRDMETLPLYPWEMLVFSMKLLNTKIKGKSIAVSYTHLTLPTILLV